MAISRGGKAKSPSAQNGVKDDGEWKRFIDDLYNLVDSYMVKGLPVSQVAGGLELMKHVVLKAFMDGQLEPLPGEGVIEVNAAPPNTRRGAS